MRRFLVLLVTGLLLVAGQVPASAATGTLLQPAGASLYPRAIRLQHSGAANGRILASVVSFRGSANGVGVIHESTNNGASFAEVGTVADPEAANNQGLCCATLFEL